MSEKEVLNGLKAEAAQSGAINPAARAVGLVYLPKGAIIARNRLVTPGRRRMGGRKPPFRMPTE